MGTESSDSKRDARGDLVGERYEDAIATYRERLASAQPEPLDHHNLAVCYYKIGAFDNALESLETATRELPELPHPWYLRGLIHQDCGGYDQAIDAFTTALKLFHHYEPTSRQEGFTAAKVLFHRGTAHFLARDKKGAMEDLLKAVTLAPGFLAAQYNLGVVAVAAGRWHRAVEAFSCCIELDPVDQEDYVRLLIEIGRAEAMEEVYDQGHRLKNRIGVVGDEYRRMVSDLKETVADKRLPIIGTRLEALFSDMVSFLNVLQRKPLEFVLVDMEAVLAKCLFALSGRLKGLKVTTEFEANLPEIIGDRAALEEVIVNILLNAADAAGKSGTIELTVQAASDARMTIIVRDSGSGIPTESLGRVFEFGYTTKEFGSGLGLSVARRVIEAHGGVIEVGSVEGQGTTFTIHLPISPSADLTLNTLEIRSLLFEDLRDLVVLGEDDAELEIEIEGGR